jgi:hypothetical protein
VVVVGEPTRAEKPKPPARPTTQPPAGGQQAGGQQAGGQQGQQQQQPQRQAANAPGAG